MGLFDDEPFYRIGKLPPYVFAVINEMRAKARAAQLDVIDLGMGNPDGATPRTVVSKLVEASRNKRNHCYSMSRGIPRLREEITKRYRDNYGVELDSEREAIVTVGAKDAIAHLLFAVIGPGDKVATPGPLLSHSSVGRGDGRGAGLQPANAHPGRIPQSSGRSLPDLLEAAQDGARFVSAQSDHALRRKTVL